MPFEPTKTPLPGVGVRYTFATAHGGRLAIVDRDDGIAELYYHARADQDEPSVVITLEADEARQASAVLGGAYRRPRLVHELEIALGELVIEWVPLPDESPLIGRTIGEAEIRKRTGVTVIAIVRQPHPVAAVEPTDRLQRGDVLITVGRLDDYESFRDLVLRGSTDEGA